MCRDVFLYFISNKQCVSHTHELWNVNGKSEIHFGLHSQLNTRRMGGYYLSKFHFDSFTSLREAAGHCDIQRRMQQKKKKKTFLSNKWTCQERPRKFWQFSPFREAHSNSKNVKISILEHSQWSFCSFSFKLFFKKS